MAGFRYKYSCGEWQMNGKGDAPIPEQPQVHQGGVVSGKQLMENKINFDYLRITNNTQHSHMVSLPCQSPAGRTSPFRSPSPPFPVINLPAKSVLFVFPRSY